MNPHFKLPLSKHPEVPYAVVDGEGTLIGSFGRHGDGDQAGSAIADAFIRMANGESGEPEAEITPARLPVVEETAAPLRKRSRSTQE